MMQTIARGTVALVNAAKKLQQLQARLLDGEVKDHVEHMEPYGFSAHPQSGSEVVVVFVDGDRSHGLAIVAADRRYRLTNLAAGEVAIYDDLGHSVVLRRTGIAIDGGGHSISISNTPQVAITGGDVVADGISLKNHIHGSVQTGSGTTGAPQ